MICTTRRTKRDATRLLTERDSIGDRIIGGNVNAHGVNI